MKTERIKTKMKRLIRLNALLICLFLLASLFLAAVPAHAVANSLFFSGPASVTQGSTFSVDLHEDSGTDAINEVQSDFDYFSSQLTLVSLNVASGWTAMQNDTSTPGFAVFVAAPSSGTFTGDQVIATATFQATGTGDTDLLFYCVDDSGGTNTCPGGNFLNRASDSVNVLTSEADGSFTINHDQLNSGQTLVAGQYLYSQNVLYKLAMQTDGNLVLYGNNLKPLWYSGTWGSGANRMVMQNDGNLVLYNASNNPVWYSGTWGRGASSLFIQDDGNVVVYPNVGAPSWSSRTGGHQSPAYYGSYYILDSQSMPSGQYLKSSDERHALRLQSDGNLVLYSPGYHVIWSTGTGGSGANHLDMQNDGNLALYRANNSPVWSTRTWNAGPSYVDLQDDGNLVVYTVGGGSLATWASNTSGQF